MNLINNNNLVQQDGELFLLNDFILSASAKDFFTELKNIIQWKQEGMMMFGKYVNFPRLTAWYADEGKTYEYSGLKNIPNKWTAPLLSLKSKIEIETHSTFNSVLLNYYRNGHDSMGWHSDDEPELGANPIIASLNLGAARKIQFRHRYHKEQKLELELSSGSLLIMKGSIQHFWQHQIPKQTKIVEPRINLTFRNII